MKLGGIEAGGTKMVCAVGDEQGNIFDRAVFPTETPEITVPKMIAYFRDKGIEALGIGCFGPDSRCWCWKPTVLRLFDGRYPFPRQSMMERRRWKV